MSDLLIKGLTVIATMDSAGTEVKDADILIENQLIRTIGPNLAAPPGGRVIDGRGKIAIPGFVNTHHHMFQIYSRDLPAVAEARNLMDWLHQNSLAWSEIDEEMVYMSALVGLGLLLKTGCTLVSDNHYLFPARAGKKLMDAQIRAARELGIRFLPVRGAISIDEATTDVYVPEICETDDEILLDCERLAKLYHDPSPFSMIRIAVGPVSPYSASERLMRETVALARSHGLRCHTHLAESPAEDAWCQEAHGMRPLQWMETLEWTGPDVWYAHGIYLNDEEIQRMGEHGSGLAHCPVSNAISGRIAPISRFLEHGVPVGFGVDGGAGFGDMMAEIQTATVLHAYRGSLNGDFAPLGSTARQMLHIATQGGARVLGWEEAGSLAPGKAADITLIDTRQLDYAGCISDPTTSAVLFGANHMVDMVIVNGEVVVENGGLTRIDESEVVARVRELSSAFVKRVAKRLQA